MNEKLIELGEFIHKSLLNGSSKTNPAFDEAMLLFVYNSLTLLKEQEAKYGYWINPTSQDCHCSECGEQPIHEPGESVPLYDFCPYCGAKMEAKWNEQPRTSN